MIESYHWRQELRAELSWLRRHRTYRRWTEKQMVLFERRLILAVFQVRVLLDQHSVRSTIASQAIDCTWFRQLGEGPVTRINSHRLERHFALDEPETVRLGARDLSNQLIHHYDMYAASEGKQFAVLLVFSDRMRNKGLYQIPIPELLQFVAMFASDDIAVTRMVSTWNPKKQDYDVIAD